MPLTEIETFSISLLQILDEAGKVDKKLEPDLTEEDLLGIYRTMTRARELDRRMLNLQRQGRIGTFGPTTGQEASTVGPAFAMGENDWLVTSFRELGARLQRGEPAINALTFHNGYEEGNTLPEGVNGITPISIIVGSQTLHAAGIAYALRYRGVEDAAVVTFFGDGASSEGDVYEAMNFAGVWNVPVVFICQNNQWAISVPRSHQTAATTLAQKAIAAGIRGIQVDGNDVLAMYAATKEALERAKAGEGPTLIEAITYRLLMHTTADDPKKYRDEAEEQEAWTREPLIRYRAYLEGKGIWNEEKQSTLQEEMAAEIEGVVQEFEAMTDFPPEILFDHVYGTQHAEIEAQKAQFLANLSRERADA